MSRVHRNLKLRASASARHRVHTNIPNASSNERGSCNVSPCHPDRYVSLSYVILHWRTFAKAVDVRFRILNTPSVFPGKSTSASLRRLHIYLSYYFTRLYLSGLTTVLEKVKDCRSFRYVDSFSSFSPFYKISKVISSMKIHMNAKRNFRFFLLLCIITQACMHRCPTLGLNPLPISFLGASSILFTVSRRSRRVRIKLR